MGLPQNSLSEEEKQKIIELEKIHRLDGGISPEFSCTLCKNRINPSTCEECPVYVTIFNPD